MKMKLMCTQNKTFLLCAKNHKNQLRRFNGISNQKNVAFLWPTRYVFVCVYVYYAIMIYVYTTGRYKKYPI